MNPSLTRCENPNKRVSDDKKSKFFHLKISNNYQILSPFSYIPSQNIQQKSLFNQWEQEKILIRTIFYIYLRFVWIPHLLFNKFMSNTFKIVFANGKDYQANDIKELQEFKHIIYDNFCLLSWLIPDYKIRVLDHTAINDALSVKRFLREPKKDAQYQIVQEKVANFIYYSINRYEEKDAQQQRKMVIEPTRLGEGIRAEFVKSNDLDRFIIKIDCRIEVKFGLPFREVFEDISPMHFNYFKPPNVKPTSLKRSLTDVEYYFIEPENRRYFEPKGYHLNLAFQGGGTKGVSYVGVKKAINNLQDRIKKQSNGKIELPIKSVIGSSAGGILSLAISAGIKHEDLIDLCYMMDTLIEDRFISTEQLTRPQFQPQYFDQQSTAIKNLLHNFGLVEDSLSEILFATLKEPSVQHLIMQLFQQLNPSVASLLSFQEPYELGRGQTINSCLGACCCCSCSKCCFNQSDSYRKVNIYGLLCAALMTGDAVQNIIAYALSLFLQKEAVQKSQKLYQLVKRKKWFQDKLDVFVFIIEQAEVMRKKFKKKQGNSDKSYLNNVLIDISKTLTLKEYYDLNGVEFTCTSVDLHDKVERFFNHKTAPQLPICRAVQMMGSFPVAFLALTWRRQWGKYYVHYDRTRREISLEGHQFTDGGLLANFPLKFLDNEKFREKYFSHKKVEGQTFLYGFGLDQLQDFPEDDKSEKVSECLARLLTQIKYRLMCKLMLYLMKCSNKATLEVKGVKLFQFLASLLDALRESDRNLNKQCFKSQIIHTHIQKRSMRTIEQLKAIKKPISSYLNQITANIQNHFYKNRQQFLQDQFNSIYDKCSTFEIAKDKNQVDTEKYRGDLGWQKVEEMLKRLKNNVLGYSPRGVQAYQKELMKLGKQYSNQQIFLSGAPEHHEIHLLELLYKIKKVFLELPQEQFKKVKEKMHQNYKLYQYQIRSIYEKIYQYQDRQDNIQKLTFVQHEQVLNLLNMKYKLSPYVFNLFHQTATLSLFKHITPSINFYIEEQVYMRKRSIRTAIKREVQQKLKKYSKASNSLVKLPKVHVVFEAAPYSHYYYSYYIKLVDDALIDKELDINIISCTSYHALFGVLYVLGYDNAGIESQMYEIKYLFEQNTKIEQRYNSKGWMKSNLEQVKTLLKRQWQDLPNPFSMAQANQDLQRVGGVNKQLINQMQVGQQRMSTALQKVIDYFSASYLEISSLSSEKRKDRFEQLLSLGKYNKINERLSKKTEAIITYFLEYTINIFVSVAQHIFEKDFGSFSSNNWNQQTIFKGMMINSLLNTLKYRKKIYEILDNANLNRNITLSNFYNVCSRKILLNFNCINTTEQRFALINKVTKPNMPLWAALMASASLPFLDGEFASRREWDHREKQDRKMDLAERVFKQYEEGSSGGLMNYFISSNLISTLPLQILTNQRLIDHRLCDEGQENNQVIEIAFSFDLQLKGYQKSERINQHKNVDLDRHQESHRQIDESIFPPIQKIRYQTSKQLNLINNTSKRADLLSQIPQKMEGKRKFINCCDALRYMCQYICCCCCDLSGVGGSISDLVGRLSTLKMLNIRINSHDNLILSIYYDSLIKLPLRIGTLDFYKISKNRPDLNDTILQAEKVVDQLCSTIQVGEGQTTIVPTVSSKTTIQLSRHRYGQKQYCRLKFISYTKWREFTSKYIIQYSLQVSEEDVAKVSWLEIKDDYIDIEKERFIANSYQILLKFTYYKDKLVFKYFLLSIEAFQQIQMENGRLVFSMKYREHFNQEKQIRIINQEIKQKIGIKAWFLPKASLFCQNKQCSARRLQYSLLKEEYSTCFSCEEQAKIVGKKHKNKQEKPYEKSSLIAMRCPSCRKTYCLKCKITRFVVKVRKNGTVNQFQFLSPSFGGKYSLGFSPITYKFKHQNQVKAHNICCYCEKYCERLFYEREIVLGTKSKDQFCGLRICQGCLYAVA